MTNNDFTTNKEIELALKRIVEFRKLILTAGSVSLFSHGEINDKTRRSDHMTLYVMIDDLCEAVEGEFNYE